MFLLVLAVATALSAVVRRNDRLRHHARRGMAAAMVVAGITHLVQPRPFEQHLPDWVPGRPALVAISGLVEIALGLALVVPRGSRRRAGRILAAYLVAVFPANVHVAVADVDVDGQPGGLYRWVRLPLQLLFIGWALWSTDTDRPSRPVVSTPSAADARPSTVVSSTGISSTGISSTGISSTGPTSR